jgi:hypothetical protein
MSALTFQGWLKLQIHSLSGNGSLNLSKLVSLAEKDRPRLFPYILCYAHEIKMDERVLRRIMDDDICDDFQKALEVIGNHPFADLPETEYEQLPWNYHKLLASWNAASHKNQSIQESKRLRWEATKRLQIEKHISNADIYNALNLNKGNTNAYLKDGDISKLSLDNATRIMKYLYAA